MASLQARHSRSCALRRPWTTFDDAAERCTCSPLYHVVYRDLGKLVREPVGHDRDLAEQALAEIRGVPSVVASLTVIRLHVERAIAVQERQFGEAAPHFLIVLDAALRAEQLAIQDAASLSEGYVAERRAARRTSSENLPTSKRCPRCGLTKPHAMFYKRRKQLGAYCKACTRDYQRERAAKVKAFDANRPGRVVGFGARGRAALLGQGKALPKEHLPFPPPR